MTAGCEDPDTRLARMAEHAIEQQAAQNEELARLNREVAEGTRQLIEADAAARQELLAAQQELQRQQSEVNAQRDALEAERRAWARQRRTESVLAPILTTLGTALLALLPLVLCWYLLHGLSRTPEQQVAELLIEELAAEQPTLLPPPSVRPACALEHRPDPADEDGSDPSP
jgi:hypothetical protein